MKPNHRPGLLSKRLLLVTLLTLAPTQACWTYRHVSQHDRQLIEQAEQIYVCTTHQNYYLTKARVGANSLSGLSNGNVHQEIPIGSIESVLAYKFEYWPGVVLGLCLGALGVTTISLLATN
jgi:hypothetical protein